MIFEEYPTSLSRSSRVRRDTDHYLNNRMKTHSVRYSLHCPSMFIGIRIKKFSITDQPLRNKNACLFKIPMNQLVRKSTNPRPPRKPEKKKKLSLTTPKLAHTILVGATLRAPPARSSVSPRGALSLALLVNHGSPIPRESTLSLSYAARL